MCKKIVASIMVWLMTVTMLLTPAYAISIPYKDSFLLEAGERYLKTNYDQFHTRSFSVEESEGGMLKVDVDGHGVYYIEKMNTKSMPSEFIIEGESFSTKEEKTIISGKEKVVSFIQNTSFVEEADKEELIYKIENTTFHLAEFGDNDKWAVAIYKEGKVYVNKRDYSITEWLVVHELIHALKDYLDGECWLETGRFIEGMTDVITAEIIGDPFKKLKSGYVFFHQFAYSYIGVFGFEGVKSFLYGTLDEELEIPRKEYELFIYCINNANDEEYGTLCQYLVYNCLENWRMNRTSK